MKRALTPVLIVDDDEPARSFIQRSLESLGVQDIKTAADGADAVMMLEGAQFGLIISDWHMPIMGGLQLLKHVRGTERFAHIPFVMITGDAQVDIVLSARQAGADAVVLKPFGLDVLRNKIGDVVKQRPKYAHPFMNRPDRVLPVASSSRALRADLRR